MIKSSHSALPHFNTSIFSFLCVNNMPATGSLPALHDFKRVDPSHQLSVLPGPTTSPACYAPK